MQRVVTNLFRGSRLLLALSTTVAVLGGVVGCGGAAKAKVTGKVMYQGQPVQGGSVTLAPQTTPDAEQAARPAAGEVKPDGTFVLGTDRTADGAAIGTHKVNYSVPVAVIEWDGYGQPPPGAYSPYAGLVPLKNEIEVKPGENEVIIELVNPAAPR